MSIKKTNIDYLRNIIDANEKNFEEDNYKEASEFLDAIQEDNDDFKMEQDNKKDEIKDFEKEILSLESRMLEMDDEPKNKINAGIGIIKWESDNIQLQYIMEALEEKLKTNSPNSIVDHINAMR